MYSVAFDTVVATATILIFSGKKI